MSFLPECERILVNRIVVSEMGKHWGNTRRDVRFSGSIREAKFGEMPEASADVITRIRPSDLEIGIF